jgi:guanosine-3',5'-bis(diphosphate) 3'-pyrophosphohydrolase
MDDSSAQKLLFDAVAFAARAHRHQLRKDGQTPYVSHPLRVCLVLRQVFGVDDVRMLAAAVLHDTIEDTNTDCDDLIECFGPEVADWVAALSKDKRLPEDKREPDFIRAFCAADWPVHLIKLADVYDNIQDSNHFPPAQRKQLLAKWQAYIDALAQHVNDKTESAYQIVRKLFDETWKSLTAHS